MYLLCCAIFAITTIAKGDSWCCDQPDNFEDKMAKLVVYNNHNNDSVVDLGDIEYDLNENYDKNSKYSFVFKAYFQAMHFKMAAAGSGVLIDITCKDNKTSKTEWVLARECLFGDSYGYAEYVFSRIDRDKDGFVTIDDVSKGPIGTAPLSVAAFEARSRSRYQNYTNGWCCDQPVDFEAKIAKLLVYNNHNNDSVVDLADIEYDLNENYDKNQDNKTSKVEWVLARECLFGDDVGYSEFVFGQIDRDKDGFVTVADVSKGPIGKSAMTLAAFEARSRSRYQSYANGAIIG